MTFFARTAISATEKFDSVSACAKFYGVSFKTVKRAMFLKNAFKQPVFYAQNGQQVNLLSFEKYAAKLAPLQKRKVTAGIKPNKLQRYICASNVNYSLGAAAHMIEVYDGYRTVKCAGIPQAVRYVLDRLEENNNDTIKQQAKLYSSDKQFAKLVGKTYTQFRNVTTVYIFGYKLSGI